jgi:hypothetical protein
MLTTLRCLMIDLAAESTLSLAAAARTFPPGRGGRPTSLSCVLRWVLTGCRAPDGSLVRLEAVRLGGRWVTSREAIQRFADRLTPLFAVEPALAPRASARRQRASERAARELDRAGI